MVDGGMCEHCQSSLGYIVDHIEELTESNITDPEIALNYNNLQYLCLICHNSKTFVKYKLQCAFDSEGNPVVKDNSPPPIEVKIVRKRRTEGAPLCNTQAATHNPHPKKVKKKGVFK